MLVRQIFHIWLTVVRNTHVNNYTDVNIILVDENECSDPVTS